jgi:putative endonuclease
MGKHNDLGKKGEQTACDFLIEKNWEILEKNWRTGRAEVDIIAKDRHVLVFVEVKTRTNDIFEKPEEAVSTKKRRLMIRAAINYMLKINHDGAIRFDIIGIIIKNEKHFIEHIPDAFFPGIDVG